MTTEELELVKVSPQAFPAPPPHQFSWLKFAVTMGSALAGGMAAAWVYRKTLTQLRQAENSDPVSPRPSDSDD